MVTSYMWEKTVKQIEDLEQENRELQISCDGFAEQCSKLEAKGHNIEEGLRRLDVVLNDLGYIISGDSHGGKSLYKINGDWELTSIQSAPTLADLIDAILIGGTTDEA